MDLRTHPIVIVDDDLDDLELIEAAYKELSYDNDLILFRSGEELRAYLASSEKSPFVILCELRLPKKNGFEIREDGIEDRKTRYKSVPFLIWSNGAMETQIRTAYDLMIQGFFVKPSSFVDLKQTLRHILDYWRLSLHPSKD